MSGKSAKVTISMEPELRDAFHRKGIEISPLVYRFLRAYALKNGVVVERRGVGADPKSGDAGGADSGSGGGVDA